MKQYEPAKELFTKSIALDPKNTQSYINLGMANYSLGDKKQAKIDWEKAIDLLPNDDDSKALNNLANLYKEEEKYDLAIQYYEKAMDWAPGNTLFLDNLAEVYRKTKNYDKAEEVLTKSLKLNDRGLLAQFNLGMVYKDQNQLEKAISAFDQSLKINPFYTEAYYQLADVQRIKNDIQSARANIQKALAAEPDNAKYKEFILKLKAS